MPVRLGRYLGLAGVELVDPVLLVSVPFVLLCFL